jgi:hypothetical protein
MTLKGMHPSRPLFPFGSFPSVLLWSALVVLLWSSCFGRLALVLLWSSCFGLRSVEKYAPKVPVPSDE